MYKSLPAAWHPGPFWLPVAYDQAEKAPRPMAAGRLNIFIHITDVDSLDWKDPAPSEIVSRVVKNARNGSIILFHNAAKNTPEALPDVIDGLVEKGFSFAPVSELIYTDGYTMDHTGRQIPNKTDIGSGA